MCIFMSLNLLSVFLSLHGHQWFQFCFECPYVMWSILASSIHIFAVFQVLFWLLQCMWPFAYLLYYEILLTLLNDIKLCVLR